jgi:hypothetical protein
MCVLDVNTLFPLVKYPKDKRKENIACWCQKLLLDRLLQTAAFGPP